MIEFNIYFLIILGTVVVFYHLDLFSEILNLRSLSDDVPEEFRDTFDAEAYRNAQEYTRVRTRFGIVESTFGLAVFLLFWLLGGFGWLDGLVRGWVEPNVLRGLLFIGLLLGANFLLELPFDAYSTFHIEERFGFNQTTVRTFVLDRIKGLVLAALLGAPVLALVLWLFQSLEWAWFYAFLAVTAFSLLMTYLAPRWILPLFNQFAPMEDGELKDSIQAMADRCGFPLTEVSVMDGSKRSSKSNAFFTGFGKNKKIALFDTLVENHTVPELVAVLAHEIGHYQKKHILQGMVISIAQLAATFFLLSLFLHNEGLFAAFGVRETSVYLSLVFFGLLYQPISKLLSIAMTVWSRKNEFEADAYAAEVTGQPDQLVSALKKLSRDNLSNLTPHPLHVFLNDTHPPVLRRIAALRRA